MAISRLERCHLFCCHPPARELKRPLKRARVSVWSIVFHSGLSITFVWHPHDHPNGCVRLLGTRYFSLLAAASTSSLENFHLSKRLVTMSPTIDENSKNSDSRLIGLTKKIYNFYLHIYIHFIEVLFHTFHSFWRASACSIVRKLTSSTFRSSFCSSVRYGFKRCPFTIQGPSFPPFNQIAPELYTSSIS